MTLPSPCAKLYELDAPRRCRGCDRTIDGITRWRSMRTRERMRVAARLDESLRARTLLFATDHGVTVQRAADGTNDSLHGAAMTPARCETGLHAP